MVFVSRKIVYPFFVAIILLVFFSLLYIGFFSNDISIDNSASSVSIIGDQVVIKIPLQNNSNHVISDISVVVKSDLGSRTFYIKGSKEGSNLAPKENYVFLASVPLGESYLYNASIIAPFNRPINMEINIDPATVNPVEAQVLIPSKLILNKEYTYSVNLCNVSPSDLQEVYWLEVSNDGDFKENSFGSHFNETIISIKKNECKAIYSTLTPIRDGNITIGFSLRVGALKKEVSKVLTVEKS